MSSMIKDLLNPDSLPDRTKSVALVQTHISYLLIADEFVYKIKKPVNFGFLNFSTLKKRRYYCRREITLNQRLSRGIYIAVLPVLYDGTCHRIGIGKGSAVEYAVKMKRLPDELLMKSMVLNGELQPEHLDKVSIVLSKFHSTTRNSNYIDTFGSPEKIKVNTDENFLQTEPYIGVTIQKKEHDALQVWTNNFYHTNRKLFLERIDAKKIRDCHGDLHMEHVCFTEDLSIFDCIEFNNRFRYIDSLSDIAFLLMDLEFHGARNLVNVLWNRYREMAREPDVEALLTFYKVYRAVVRGKVNSFRLNDDSIDKDKKTETMQTAARYFELARSYIG